MKVSVVYVTANGRLRVEHEYERSEIIGGEFLFYPDSARETPLPDRYVVRQNDEAPFGLSRYAEFFTLEEAISDAEKRAAEGKWFFGIWGG